MPNKEEVADLLAEVHYIVEPGISHIIRLRKDDETEEDPSEPIKLLEVNDASIPVGIQPLYFRPHPPSGILYASIIVEITPDEFERFNRGDENLRLPEGWRVGEEIERKRIGQVSVS